MNRSPESAEQAAELLANVTGNGYHFVGSLTGGETGATAITRADGARFVLKWELDPQNQRARREGARLAERLRVEARWPSPRQRLIETEGCLLIVQEFMQGSTIDRLTDELVGQIIALHEARLDLVPPEEPSSWADDMIELLIVGGNGYCLHEPLRAFDSRSRRIVERIEEIGRTTDTADVSGHDVIHADLHPGNLLQMGGRLTAVVDLDYARVGDAHFDLTMLAITSIEANADPGVHRRLFEVGVDTLSAPKRRVYTANLLLRLLDWAIRKGRTAEIEFWLSKAGGLLDSG